MITTARLRAIAARLLLGPGALSWMLVPAAVARELHEVIDPHPAGEQSDGQKEADNKYGNHHEYPGYRFDTAHAEALKEAGAECADEEPPHDCVIAAH